MGSRLALALLLCLSGCPKRKEPERGYQLVFRSSAARDVRPVVERRLAQLGVTARIDVDDEHLVIRLPGGTPGAPVDELKAVLLTPGKLEFCVEAKPEPRRLCSLDEKVSAHDEESPRTDCYLTGPSALEIARRALGGVDGGAPKDVRVLVGQSTGDGDPRTFLAEPACLSPRILEAEVRTDRDVGRPMLNLTFDGPGADAFAELTGRAVSRRLLVVLDDRVTLAPVVREQIRGGRAVISPGAATKSDDVERLKKALLGGPLPASLSLEREGPYGPPSLAFPSPRG